MTLSARQQSDVARVRSDLAGLSVSLGWLRFERSLICKYRPDLRREPRGNPGAGQWVEEGPEASGNDSNGGSSRTEETITAGGSRVLTLRIRSNPSAEPIEHYTVVSPDGERTVFENEGWTQTIRDGETGAILGRSTLTRDGAEPEAFVQPARSPLRQAAETVVERTLEAAATLYAVLSEQNNRNSQTLFVGPASEYKPSEGADAVPIWVGKVDQSDLDVACPRNGEVQTLADETAARVRKSGGCVSEQDFGNKVDLLIAREVNSRNDSNFIAEKSYNYSGRPYIPYGTAGSIRVDVLERSAPSTVCIYDHKVGKSGLGPRRAVEIVSMVQRNFQGVSRFLMIEVRPRQ